MGGVSPELWLAIATGVLASASVAATFFAWRFERRRRALELISRRLDEFYFPLIEAFRHHPSDAWSRKAPGDQEARDLALTERVRALLLSKRYLALDRTLKAWPIDPEVEIEFVSGYWQCASSDLLRAWEDRVRILIGDANDLVALYYRLSGTRPPTGVMENLTWGFAERPIAPHETPKGVAEANTNHSAQGSHVTGAPHVPDSPIKPPAAEVHSAT